MSTKKRIIIVLFCLFISFISLYAPPRVGNCRSSLSCSSRSISDDCGNGCSALEECENTICSGKSGSHDFRNVNTFFRPRPILTDLTYRNNISFYQRYHEACCSFFTYDVTWLYQRNRRAACIGAGFFGKEPLTVAQFNGDINSLNLSLGSYQPDGFSSTFTFRPKRDVFGWMPTLIFNLDCLCNGLWFDATIAVLSVHNEFCLNEKVTTPGEIDNIVNVQEAFNRLHVFADTRKHVGVDDVELRLGYDWLYCDLDHVGGYITGIVPTGRRFDNTRFFQPLVGSRNGALGFGFTMDNTIWDDDCANTALLIMTELKYLYWFRHHECRIFDFVNGPLSRFLLVTQSTTPQYPISGTNLLRQKVEIESRNFVEWWLSLHYQWCHWGFELAYNLYYRDSERVQGRCFNFDDYGIYNKAYCGGDVTQSTATIFDNFGQGVADDIFVVLEPTDVNINSGRARKQFSNTVSGSVAYNSIWRDCYPWTIGLSASYEIPGKNNRRSTLENWGVFGTWSMSI